MIEDIGLNSIVSMLFGDLELIEETSRLEDWYYLDYAIMTARGFKNYAKTLSKRLKFVQLTLRLLNMELIRITNLGLDYV